MWTDLCADVEARVRADLRVFEDAGLSPDGRTINRALLHALNVVHRKGFPSDYWTPRELRTFALAHDAEARAHNPLWRDEPATV